MDTTDTTETTKTAGHRRMAVARWLVVAAAVLLASCGSGDGGAGDEPSHVEEAWVATWATAPTGPVSLETSHSFVPTLTYENQTIRMVVRGSVAGSRVRVRFSNEIGEAPMPVRLGAAHLALRDKGHAIVAGTDQVLTFGGQTSVEVPPKGFVVSDPVTLPVDAQKDLMVSVYLPAKTTVQSAHYITRQTNYVAPGDVSGVVALPSTAVETGTWVLASAIDVAAPKAQALVAFGDSITDGVGSDTTRVDAPTPWPSWPSRLAARLQGDAKLARLGVVNQGIAGNRLMSDAPDYGPSHEGVTARAVFGGKGLERFQRDVLGQSGVSCVVVLMGVNDIGIGNAMNDPISAAQLIAGHQQLLAHARAAGLRVIGATLTPFEGYTAPDYDGPESEATRQAFNHWMRTGGAYDGVADFDAVLRDPNAPSRLRAAYDSGDHLHPNDAGLQALADSLDTAMLARWCLR